MIEINSWLKLFQQKLEESFPGRVWFLGLQGSYGRGEATETSDLDLVVILDELAPADLQRYHGVLDTLPHRELLCGFLAGKQELLNWEPSDLFQFYYDTKPILGSLDALLPLLDPAAVTRAIKIGACNIYHGCVHNMLYDKSEEILKGLYKGASFVVQAICYRQRGVYVSRIQDLREQIALEEREILDTFAELKQGGAVDFQAMSESLFTWAQKWIGNTK